MWFQVNTDYAQEVLQNVDDLHHHHTHTQKQSITKTWSWIDYYKVNSSDDNSETVPETKFETETYNITKVLPNPIALITFDQFWLETNNCWKNTVINGLKEQVKYLGGFESLSDNLNSVNHIPYLTDVLTERLKKYIDATNNNSNRKFKPTNLVAETELPTTKPLSKLIAEFPTDKRWFHHSNLPLERVYAVVDYETDSGVSLNIDVKIEVLTEFEKFGHSEYRFGVGGMGESDSVAAETDYHSEDPSSGSSRYFVYPKYNYGNDLSNPVTVADSGNSGNTLTVSNGESKSQSKFNFNPDHRVNSRNVANGGGSKIFWTHIDQSKFNTYFQDRDRCFAPAWSDRLLKRYFGRKRELEDIRSDREFKTTAVAESTSASKTNGLKLNSKSNSNLTLFSEHETRVLGMWDEKFEKVTQSNNNGSVSPTSSSSPSELESDSSSSLHLSNYRPEAVGSSWMDYELKKQEKIVRTHLLDLLREEKNRSMLYYNKTLVAELELELVKLANPVGYTESRTFSPTPSIAPYLSPGIRPNGCPPVHCTLSFCEFPSFAHVGRRS